VDRPADAAGGGETGREQLGRDADEVEQDPGVVLDVGADLSVWVSGPQGFEGESLDTDRQLDHGVVEAENGFMQCHRAGVLGSVDPVAETHDPFATMKGTFDPRFGPVEAADVDQHGQHVAGRIRPDAPVLEQLDRLEAIAEDLSQPPPNIDTGLAALSIAAGFRSGSGELIFAFGRMAGWIAHAIEARKERPVRFRATYVGEKPTDLA